MNHVWDIRSSAKSVDILFKGEELKKELDQINVDSKIEVIKWNDDGVVDDDHDPEAKF